MAAFSGGVSACHFDEIDIRNKRERGVGKKSGCFGAKKGKGLRDRIKQFNIWYNEQEEYRAKDYSERRSSKRRKRALVTREAFIKKLRWLYVLTALVWAAGLVMTFSSTVESIGKNTIFFKKKETYRIVGPLVITAGVILLFLTEGLKMNFRLSEGHVQQKFFIIQKSNKKHNNNPSGSGSFDSRKMAEHKVNGSKRKQKRKLYQISADECNSIEELDLKDPKRPKSNKTVLQSTDYILENNDDLYISNNESPNHRNRGMQISTEIDNTDMNYRDQWSPLSTESDDSIVINGKTCASDDTFVKYVHRSPKRKRHAFKRFHWTKLSQESSGSEFVVIDENEAMESSGDSTSFRRHLGEIPRSPCGTFENPLARQWSVSSRASTTSKYSNFSDDAPLIKR